MSAAGRRAAATRERRLAELGVAATVVIWSANFVVNKAAVEAFGPLAGGPVAARADKRLELFLPLAGPQP